MNIATMCETVNGNIVCHLLKGHEGDHIFSRLEQWERFRATLTEEGRGILQAIEFIHGRPIDWQFQAKPIALASHDDRLWAAYSDGTIRAVNLPIPIAPPSTLCPVADCLHPVDGHGNTGCGMCKCELTHLDFYPWSK